MAILACMFITRGVSYFIVPGWVILWALFGYQMMVLIHKSDRIDVQREPMGEEFQQYYLVMAQSNNKVSKIEEDKARK
ncbi:hypothetical protein RhiirC2_784762 [Rhizophagus irregularis]|uniref:Uncharacterized protein n=1 Tax=Rhizophagus irregularis TaxID=588596 RepID=A0A2N1MXS9_9GLOM|nr:hypothetical protein RhiirC2_784762 [Rhizophagus irregularis]